MGSTGTKRTSKPRGRARPLQPETAAKQLRCMDLAIRGLTYQEIADTEGYANHSGAQQAVARGFERAFDRRAEELRPVYQGRAELLWRHGLTLLEQGLDGTEDDEGNPVGPDLDKVRAGAQIADKALLRLMRLSGLDQPTVTPPAGGDSLAALQAELVELMNRSPSQLAAVDAEIVEVEQ